MYEAGDGKQILLRCSCFEHCIIAYYWPNHLIVINGKFVPWNINHKNLRQTIYCARQTNLMSINLRTEIIYSSWKCLCMLTISCLLLNCKSDYAHPRTVC